MPSFELSEGPEGRWVASGKIGTKTVRFSTGTKDKDAAKVIAQDRWKRKIAAQTASLARWDRWRAERRTSSAPPAPPASSSAPAPAPPAPRVPPALPPMTPTTAEAMRAAEINERIRRRGGVDEQAFAGPVAGDDHDHPEGEAPDDDETDDEEDDDATEDDTDADAGAETVHPDKIYKAGEKPETDDDGAADDPEAREWLTDAITEGVLTGTTKFGAKVARADRIPILGIKKKPRIPNEPSEKSVEMARKGLRHNLAKLMGPEIKLSPGMQIALGLSGMVLSMSWAADLADEGAAAAQGSGPRPPAAEQQQPRAGHVDNDDELAHEEPARPTRPPGSSSSSPPRLEVVRRSPAAGDGESASGKFRE